MSREYPDRIDPRKAAEGRRTFSGSMPLQRMVRLRPLLATPSGEAGFVAAFEFDAQGRVTISIEVDANLPLICQRSLEPYLEPVRRRSLLGVIQHIGEESLMPENYEPVLVEHGTLALLDLVEDELLLGMPQVPKNPGVEAVTMQTGDSEASAAPNGEPTRRPFAGLAEQLHKRAHEKED
jgi:uncharacterized protein